MYQLPSLHRAPYIHMPARAPDARPPPGTHTQASHHKPHLHSCPLPTAKDLSPASRAKS